MTTTLRIDDKLKADCDAVFSDLGINMTSAITLFLKQVVRTRGIPFEISCMSYIIEASCIAVGDFYPQFGEKRCERGARSAECLQRAA